MNPVSDPVILSIETSTPICSVALHQNGSLLASKENSSEKSHAAYLIPMILEMLDTTGIGFDDLNAIAVSKGPGSYTGLRIGVSTAKGICFAKDLPLIGVNTLEAMARQVLRLYKADDILICPMLDARRMEVYTMLINISGEVIEPVHAKIINENSFRDFLAHTRIVFIGPGSSKCKVALSGSPNAVFMDEIQASAKTVGELACRAYEKKEFENTALFEPFYLKEYQTTVPKPRI